jgi:hypothetical protein
MFIKTCILCKSRLPVTHFPPTVNQLSPRGICFDCRQEGIDPDAPPDPEVTRELKQRLAKKRSKWGVRRCRKCKRMKANHHFADSKNKSSWCRKCSLENAKNWRKTHPEAVEAQQARRKQERFRRILSKYGLTRDQYDSLLHMQGNSCAICGGPPGITHGLSMPLVDHCHKTGHVRGLLCQQCNSGIGLLKESRQAMEKAIEYLHRDIDLKNLPKAPSIPDQPQQYLVHPGIFPIKLFPGV